MNKTDEQTMNRWRKGDRGSERISQIEQNGPQDRRSDDFVCKKKNRKYSNTTLKTEFSFIAFYTHTEYFVYALYNRHSLKRIHDQHLHTIIEPLFQLLPYSFLFFALSLSISLCFTLPFIMFSTTHSSALVFISLFLFHFFFLCVLFLSKMEGFHWTFLQFFHIQKIAIKITRHCKCNKRGIKSGVHIAYTRAHTYVFAGNIEIQNWPTYDLNLFLLCFHPVRVGCSGTGPICICRSIEQ